MCCNCSLGSEIHWDRATGWRGVKVWRSGYKRSQREGCTDNSANEERTRKTSNSLSRLLSCPSPQGSYLQMEPPALRQDCHLVGIPPLHTAPASTRTPSLSLSLPSSTATRKPSSPLLLCRRCPCQDGFGAPSLPPIHHPTFWARESAAKRTTGNPSGPI